MNESESVEEINVRRAPVKTLETSGSVLGKGRRLHADDDDSEKEGAEKETRQDKTKMVEEPSGSDVLVERERERGRERERARKGDGEKQVNI
jgi:chromatin segregation and condensation protein Rec8/ScpA/Scc1 (kleisin family)